MANLKGLGRDLKKAFREADLDVEVEIRTTEGWLERGYDDFDPQGTTFHHTASGRSSGAIPSLGIVTNGRAGIPGPLCNILIGRPVRKKIIVVLIAGGKANHAGYGGPLRGIPRDSANKYTVGVEVENDGVGEPWARELLQVCDVVFAVCLKRAKEKPGRHFGHREWAPTRKIDPANVDLDKDRERVRKWQRELYPTKDA